MDSIQNEKEEAVSAVIGTILMVALVVILAAVIAALVLGLGSKVEDPKLSAFNVEPYYTTSGIPTAFSLYLMAGETVSGEAGSSQSTGGKKIEKAQVVLVDPSGKNNLVTLCSAITGTIELNPGTQYYVVKRAQPNYYLVNNLTQAKCGGGSGSGSGSGSTSNLQLTSGSWRVTISDLVSGNVLYEKEFTI